MIANDEVEMMANQWDMIEGRLRPRASAKFRRGNLVRAKIKCDICNKFYRADYMKVRLKYKEDRYKCLI
jgi:hypothetical protein